MNLEIRDLQKEDLSKIKQITADVFLPDKVNFQIPDKVIDAAMTLMYMGPLLNKANFAKVAVLEGEVAGVIMGSNRQSSASLKPLLDDYSAELITLMRLDKQEQEMLIAFIVKTAQSYAKLIKGKEQQFDGCLEFFALDAAAQGKQIGKKLLAAFLDEQSNYNAARIYVYTDTLSNYGFYDHMGFERLGEDTVPFELPNYTFENTNFIYQYIL